MQTVDSVNPILSEENGDCRITFDSLPCSDGIRKWFFGSLPDKISQEVGDTKLKEVENSYNRHRNHRLTSIEIKPEEFILTFSNGMESKRPQRYAVGFLSAWYALAFHDPRKGDAEKVQLEKLVACKIRELSMNAANILCKLESVVKGTDEDAEVMVKLTYIGHVEQINNNFYAPVTNNGTISGNLIK